MKILIVNIPAAEEFSESGKFFKTVLAPLMRRNLDLFRKQDTELTFRFPIDGILDEMRTDCHHLNHINPDSMFQSVLEAEKDGFDAAMITCFHDEQILKALRPLVSIPVVGIAESSLLMAILSGRKFGFVGLVPNPDIVHPMLEEMDREMKQWIARYDLNKKYIGTVSAKGTGLDEEIALTDAKYVIDPFKKAAKSLVNMGAELILPTCGLIPSVLRLAPGSEKEYPDGLDEVDGVPIVNSLGSALKMAEMLVDSKSVGFQPVKSKVTNAERKIAAKGAFKFWDC
jgi:Asp/Glu/hydantoin racemase